MLVVFLPWVHLRSHVWMNTNLATAGLRALDLLEGNENGDGRVTPPLTLWVQAVAMTLPFADKSLALAAPSAIFAILSGLVLCRLGRVWYSPAVGVLAAVLLVFHRLLLAQIHHHELYNGEPGPIVLFLTLVCLWTFAEHVRRQDDVFSRWTFLGAFGTAGLILTAGVYAVLMALFGAGAMFFRGGDPEDRWPERVRLAMFDASTRAGLIAILSGTAIAAPWLASAPWKWGAWFPWESPDVVPAAALGWWDAFAFAPAVVVLAAVGLFRTARGVIDGGLSDPRDALPLLWTLGAAVAFSVVGSSTALLVLAAPMCLLAARTILDIVERKIDDRRVLFLTTGVLVACIVWQTIMSFEPPLRAREGAGLKAQDWIAIFTGAAAALLAPLLLTMLYRVTRQDDSPRRSLLGGIVVAVVVVTCAPGAMLLRGRPRTDDPWFQVQQRIARLVAAEHPDLVLFLDSEGGGRGNGGEPRTAVLEFLVRTLAPRREREFVQSPEELERKLIGYERPLVLVTLPARRLPKIYSFAHGSRVLTLTERLDTDRVTLYSPLAAPSTD